MTRLEHEKTTEASFLGHESCPECSSKDNLGRYDDGHGFCFGCGYYEPGDGEAPAPKAAPKDVRFKDGKDFEKTIRGIKPATFQHWKYKVGEGKDGPIHIANHFVDGRLSGQKIRGKGKSFAVIGKMDTLYGKWLWNPSKRLVVTEGELDALSVSQVQGNKWPVVSIPNGAQGAKKAIAAAIDWVSEFEEVVFMFDMDEPGQEAAVECAQLLKPGQAKIAQLPLKDANEMVKAGRSDDVMKAIWNAKTYRPDGIVTLDQLKDAVLRPVEWGRAWPWDDLTQATYGRRDGDVITLGAGTGIGKTDFLTECILFDLVDLKLPVGVLMLEQDPVETSKRIAGKLANKRFHVPDADWTTDDLSAAVELLDSSGKLFLYDSFGSTDWDTIKNRIRYLAVACGCKHIYLDHLTALAAHADDERKAIEQIMAELAGMAKELRVTLHVVSHLSTPEGKPHEEGGRVMIRHFKGSRAIGFWSYFMIGLERNQQDEDESRRNITTVRILKDRYTGQSTGDTFELGYDHATGRLSPAESIEESGGSPFDADTEDIY